MRAANRGKPGNRSAKAPDGSFFNQEINGHLYWYQEEWSNQGARMPAAAELQRRRADGDVHEQTGGRHRSPVRRERLDGARRRLQIQLAVQRRARARRTRRDGSADRSATRSRPPGTYTVALTVFAEDGTSIGTAKAVADCTGRPRSPRSHGGVGRHDGAAGLLRRRPPRAIPANHPHLHVELRGRLAATRRARAATPPTPTARRAPTK